MESDGAPLHNGLRRPSLPTTASYASLDASFEPSFDEAVLRNLCDIDCGLPLLLDRLRQSSASCKEASTFFRKRAQVEEEYAKASIKLARLSLDSYRESEGKAGTFVTSYAAFLRTHEMISDNHLKFATQLVDMSDQLLELSKEADRARKEGKDVGSRLERTLAESESSMEKARLRFDSSIEELERCLVAKAGESPRTDPMLLPYTASTSSVPGQNLPQKRTFGKAMSKLKSTSKSNSRNEEELRSKMTMTSEAYRKEVAACQAIRRDHWVNNIPRILRSLKETVDEIDNGTTFQLSRYAYLYEHLVVNDGCTVSPPGGIEQGPGLKAVVESLDSREDFRKYMEMYNVTYLQTPAGMKGPAARGEGMLDIDGYVTSSARPQSVLIPPTPNDPVGSQAASQSKTSSSLASTNLASNAKASFGLSLNDLMDRDGIEVPRILEECAAVIEAHGLDVTGIYRLSGTTSKVQRLKAKLDADVDRVDLSAPEHISDINDISGVLKLWFRELPEPLMTFELYPNFIEAAKIENDRLRHIRLHERVNELPDSHYATLKFLMGHLDKIQKNHGRNSMSISNLAIVFGPTLFRPPRGQEASALQDMTWQCKAVETILSHYEAIFVPAEDGSKT